MSARPKSPKPDTLVSVLLGAFLLIVVIPWILLLLAYAGER